MSSPGSWVWSPGVPRPYRKRAARRIRSEIPAIRNAGRRGPGQPRARRLSNCGSWQDRDAAISRRKAWGNGTVRDGRINKVTSPVVEILADRADEEH